MRTVAVLAASIAVTSAFQSTLPSRSRASHSAVDARRTTALKALEMPKFEFKLPTFEFPSPGGNSKIGNKKICVITGASSGLGLEATRVLTTERDDYFVVAAVRDVEKMAREAERMGIPSSKYAALELELADLKSVRAFAKNLVKFKGGKPLDCLVCNAAVYRPTDPEPLYSEDGFEMSMAVNHLGHFLLVNLMMQDMTKNKAKDARVVIVGSITGNSNTVGGGLVYPRADVGNFQGWDGERAGKNVPMVDGKPFFGAKAYKDAKVCNMMTVAELDRRYHADTGITFSSLYPGCIAETPLFREKRQWFRDLFPLFMKYVTGGYVSMPESGERLAQVVTDPICTKSGVYWSWNGGAKTVAYIDPKTKTLTGAGGSGGEIFENEMAGMVRDQKKQDKMWELSSKLVGCEWPESYSKK